VADESVEESSHPLVVSALTLGARGRRLMSSMRKDYEFDPVQTELLVEACRIVDQLDELDAMIRGDKDSWRFVNMPRNGGTLVLEIGQVVDKQRQLQLALKQITTTLTVAGEGSRREAPDDADELRDRREARVAAKRERAAARESNPQG
jgi:hypothetical protein